MPPGRWSAMGVFLKGDLPILMSRESVDVWAERDFFDLTGIAGAPPDMFSPDGQNWGFPVYDWESLGREDYRWWKDRLKQAGKFFHAFRIDHVLGFFRIWRIPQGEVTGLLGRFSPSSALSRADLEALGLRQGTAAVAQRAARQRSGDRRGARAAMRRAWPARTCGASAARTCSTSPRSTTANRPSRRSTSRRR